MQYLLTVSVLSLLRQTIDSPKPINTTTSNDVPSKEAPSRKDPNPLIDLLHDAIEKNSIETIKNVSNDIFFRRYLAHIFDVQSSHRSRRVSLQINSSPSPTGSSPLAIAANVTPPSSSPIKDSQNNGEVKGDDILEWMRYPDRDGQTVLMFY